MAGGISKGNLAAGILSADTVGRALMANGYLNDSTAFSNKVSAGAIADDRLVNKLVKHPGAAGVNTLFIDANAGAECIVGNTVVLGAETWTAQNPGSPAAFEFNIGGANCTAAQAAAAIVAAVNNVASTSIYEARDATTGADGIVEVIERVPTGAATAGWAATFDADGPDTGWSSATTQGSRVATVTQRISGTFIVGTSDVAAWAAAAGHRIGIACFNSATAPRATFIQVADTNGVIKSPNTMITAVVPVNGDLRLLHVGDPGAVLAATDVITYSIEL